MSPPPVRRISPIPSTPSPSGKSIAVLLAPIGPRMSATLDLLFRTSPMSLPAKMPVLDSAPPVLAASPSPMSTSFTRPEA
jgi:hypothetical protein